MEDGGGQILDIWQYIEVDLETAMHWSIYRTIESPVPRDAYLSYEFIYNFIRPLTCTHY
jgi:hypothetical protein